MKKQIVSKSIIIFIIMLSISSIGKSGALSPNIKEANVSYTSGGVTYKGFIAYDDNIKGKRPAVLIVPEWWGLNDYPRMRARKLAELGYVAMAADVFGNGKIAAAIGYCFGGYMVLNYAKLGADVKGVVSFHGGYGGAPVYKNLLVAKVLVCHGASDKFASQKDAEGFKHKLDSVGADNTLKIYPNAMHAFTNPASTEVGKKFNLPIEYNAEADKASWDDMKMFFGRIFSK